ncbi:MAG: hypothetical protein AAF603_00800 [Pseudomonadota bacterium]
MIDAFFFLASNMIGAPPSLEEAPLVAETELLDLEQSPLSIDEMSEARGGFLIGGYDIDFGFQIDSGTGDVISFVTNADILNRALDTNYQSGFNSSAGEINDRLTRVVSNTTDNTTIRINTDLHLVFGYSDHETAARNIFRMDQMIAAPTAFGSF